MDGRGHFHDNIFIERLWRSVKYEEVYLHSYELVRDARDGLGDYFDFYNRERRHSSLGKRTPHEVYFNGASSQSVFGPSEGRFDMDRLKIEAPAGSQSFKFCLSRLNDRLGIKIRKITNGNGLQCTNFIPLSCPNNGGKLSLVQTELPKG